jgi:hypothetical protein
VSNLQAKNSQPKKNFREVHFNVKSPTSKRVATPPKRPKVIDYGSDTSAPSPSKASASGRSEANSARRALSLDPAPQSSRNKEHDVSREEQNDDNVTDDECDVQDDVSDDEEVETILDKCKIVEEAEHVDEHSEEEEDDIANCVDVITYRQVQEEYEGLKQELASIETGIDKDVSTGSHSAVCINCEANVI